MSTDPTALRLDVGKNQFHATWSDGHESTYDGAYLRLVCPCARCRGHSPGEVEPPAWQDVQDVRVTNATGVGTYALRFDFSDGHDSGIYAYTWLREMCPRGKEGFDDAGRPRT